MPKQNQLDLITDKVNSRMESILGRIQKRLGGTNPYRQEPISRKEMMLNYDDMISRETQLREDFGNDMVDKYKANMSKYLGGK